MKAKILVIDPSVTIQKVIGIMLSDGPYEVTQCTTQEEYGQYKAQGEYDLIVADYRFADNLITQIKQDFNGAKILAMLGTFDQKDEGELLRLGADDCIVRPFESGKFVDKCNKLLKEKASAPSVTDEADQATSAAAQDNNPHFDPLPSSSVEEDEGEDISLGDSSSSSITIEEGLSDDPAFAELKEEPTAIHEASSDQEVAAAEEGPDSQNSADVANSEVPTEDGLAQNLSTDDEAFAEMDAPSAQQDTSSSSSSANETQGDEHTSLDDTLSGWSVNAPAIQPEVKAPAEALGEDALAQAVAGWGMSVPDVIGGSEATAKHDTEFTGEIPGVIGESNAADAMPAQQDLAYPDEGSSKSSAEILSKLVPLENLNSGDDGDDFTDADRTVSMEMAPDLLKNDGLEEEIAKELEAEEFWSPEEEGKAVSGENSTSTAIKIDAPKSTESGTSSNSPTFTEHLTPQILAEIKQAIPGVDKDALLAEVKQALPSLAASEMGPQLQDILRPEIDKIVQEYCQKTIEHVAWEIIPDLAENLIKQHLKTIAEEAKQSF